MELEKLLVVSGFDTLAVEWLKADTISIKNVPFLCSISEYKDGPYYIIKYENYSVSFRNKEEYTKAEYDSIYKRIEDLIKKVNKLEIERKEREKLTSLQTFLVNCFEQNIKLPNSYGKRDINIEIFLDSLRIRWKTHVGAYSYMFNLNNDTVNYDFEANYGTVESHDIVDFKWKLSEVYREGTQFNELINFINEKIKEWKNINILNTSQE